MKKLIYLLLILFASIIIPVFSQAKYPDAYGNIILHREHSAFKYVDAANKSMDANIDQLLAQAANKYMFQIYRIETEEERKLAEERKEEKRKKERKEEIRTNGRIAAIIGVLIAILIGAPMGRWRIFKKSPEKKNGG